MPFAAIRILGAPLPEATRAALARRTTDLLAGLLGKRAEVSAVLVEAVPDGRWTVGGAAVAAAAHMEVLITAGTNTAEEKARFVAAADAMLREAVPGLPAATYVALREPAAESWGYGGLTQAGRRSAAVPPP